MLTLEQVVLFSRAYLVSNYALKFRRGLSGLTSVLTDRVIETWLVDEESSGSEVDDVGEDFCPEHSEHDTDTSTDISDTEGTQPEPLTRRHRHQMKMFRSQGWVILECCARGRPIIVEWERDARHSAGLSLVR
ncbi:hypothetical protein EVAR_93281_1 [Eumeta japonica]|uniref:Uncharacterized protein n=1 Tax=Eumeta variegata TaxID=151549 RepID=A0A4C1TXR5_EUMVA|nr:hypothetical protein EVAR_93281_1 [Eumeta japonica]